MNVNVVTCPGLPFFLLPLPFLWKKRYIYTLLYMRIYNAHPKCTTWICRVDSATLDSLLPWSEGEVARRRSSSKACLSLILLSSPYVTAYHKNIGWYGLCDVSVDNRTSLWRLIHMFLIIINLFGVWNKFIIFNIFKTKDDLYWYKLCFVNKQTIL